MLIYEPVCYISMPLWLHGAGFPWYGVKVALLARTTIGPFRVETYKISYINHSYTHFISFPIRPIFELRKHKKLSLLYATVQIVRRLERPRVWTFKVSFSYGSLPIRCLYTQKSTYTHNYDALRKTYRNWRTSFTGEAGTCTNDGSYTEVLRRFILT